MPAGFRNPKAPRDGVVVTPPDVTAAISRRLKQIMDAMPATVHHVTPLQLQQALGVGGVPGVPVSYITQLKAEDIAHLMRDLGYVWEEE